ncbi:hypothetical protein ACFLYO_11765 [Chloroflexota bacterium]
MKNRVSILAVLVIVLAFSSGIASISAQEDMTAPFVEVADQLSLDGAVLVASAYSEGLGFIVIHADNGEGVPGPAIGQHALNAGWSYNIRIDIDTTMATPVLFAMLHADDNALGVYEFGQIEAADGPVMVDNAPVSSAFNVTSLRVQDQSLGGEDELVIRAVTMPESGWVVVHADADGSFGEVVGQALIEAGTTTALQIPLTGSPTNVLWPMLHVDTGVAGEYEFSEVEGADGLVVVNDQIATTRIWIVPHLRTGSQVIMHGDNWVGEMANDTGPMMRIRSVLSEGPGIVVVYQDVNGQPGLVAGFALVPAGLSVNVEVSLNTTMLTPTMWPMLHVDDQTIGSYEFGEVENADMPIVMDGKVVTFPINVAPSILFAEQAVQDGTLTFAQVIIDAPGWHANLCSGDH